MTADLRIFDNRDALADALAEAVAGTLAQAITRRGAGFLAVSGGTTPARFFGALSSKRIDWPAVSVTLVDERMVSSQSDRSNEKLVRTTLLQNEARAARFVGLYREAETTGVAAAAAEAALAPLPWPLDAAVLGMGTDGHTASFFPDAPDLGALLSSHCSRHVMPVEAASAGEPRLTLPLARLVEAGLLAVHIEGEEKRRVLEAALKDGGRLPIAAVLHAAPSPVPIYWAP